MKKNYKTIPFSKELAEKIQAGKIEGKIIRNGYEVVILDYNSKKYSGYPIRIAYLYRDEVDYVTCDGLNIEVPDNDQQFKPFDKVLMRSPSSGYVCWYPHFYCRYIQNAKDKKPHVALDGFGYEQCIPYEGNEYLVGTTDEPRG